MSNNADDKEADGRRQEAEFLFDEAEAVLARMRTLAEQQGPATELDIEKEDQMDQAERLAEQVKMRLEADGEIPTEETIADARELLKSAKMHANEAEPAFPSK